MAVIGSLVADLSGNSAAFAADMGKASRALNSNTARMNRGLATLDRAFARTTRGVGRLVTGMFGWRSIVATLAGSAGLGLLTRRALEQADAIAKTADKIGLSTDALQELRFAADLAGVSQNTLDLALQRFSRRFGEAVQGTGELKDTLKQYGIELRDSEGRTRRLEDVLGDYAEAVRRAESDQEALRLAFKGFDSEGAALVNLLRDGRAGLEAMRQKARELGIVMDESLLRRAEGAKDQLSILSTVIRTKLTVALIDLAPIIDSTATSLLNLAERAGLVFRNFAAREDVERIRELRVELRAITIAIAELEKQNAEVPVAGTAERIAQLTARFEAAAAELRALTVDPGAGDPPPAPPRGSPGDSAAVGTTGKTTADKIAEIKEQLEFERAQLTRTAAGQELYNLAKSKGVEVNAAFVAEVQPLVIALEEERAAIDAAAEEKRRDQQRAEKLKEAKERLADSIEDRLGGALKSLAGDLARGETSWRRFAQVAVDAIGDIILAFAQGQGGGGGGLRLGNFLAALFPSFGGGGEFNFQHGGRFRVGGTGGTDSQLVPLRLSPREEVEITPRGGPARSGGRGGPRIAIGAINMPNPNAEAVARLETMLARLDAEVEGRAVNAVFDERGRGGAFADAFA